MTTEHVYHNARPVALTDSCNLQLQPYMHTRFLFLIIPAKARDYVFTGVSLCVCVCVCLSVTTVTKKIVTDLYKRLCEGS